MVTTQDRARLLAVSCGWCNAAAGEDCHVRETRTDAAKGTRRYTPLPVTTLDGGFHDTRWKAAIGRTAPVITAAVPTATPTPERPTDAATGPERAPVAVGGWVP